ncbi:metallophosphoesterase family protein [Cohnella nanjingensis]|uniref:Metallophosphoesterase n=1 Tax=Cohnella nanjingensis TaxID=1387779 RepID=A0A7X0RVB2_9BACL|nr:DNA repair exonuclease [Cohnella nanjingensis]MBB6674343.1 metallophosphoesterase [Cohnella nanjingensis]
MGGFFARLRQGAVGPIWTKNGVEIEVGVPFTFLHAADLHLDSPFRGLSKVPAAVRDRLRESTFEAFARLVETVRRERIDFVVLAGDLYDAADRSLKAQLRMQRALNELAAEGVQTFVVHGNHDPAGGWQAKLDWPDAVHVFGTSDVACRPAYRRDGELAAHVYGISYPEASVTDNLASRYRTRAGAPFHLALLHANVDGNAAHDNYAPCKLAELAGAGFDYWALGHVHDRRVLREYPHVVYPGNIQGRSIRETGAKGAYVVRVSPEGQVALSFRDTASVLWRETDVSIAGADREQQLKDRLLASVDEARASAGGRPVVLRIRLVGAGPLHARLLRENAAEEWLGELREWIGDPDDRDDWVWAERLAVATSADRDEAAADGEQGFLGELARLAAAGRQDPELSRLLLAEATEPLRRQPRLREWLDGRGEDERSALLDRASALAALLLKDKPEGER